MKKTKEQIDKILMVHNPSISEVNEYVQRWRTLDNYREHEIALRKLFVELCPENKCLADILIKCSALNDFYSTNIYNIYDVALNILSWNIDNDLQVGKADLVKKIALVTDHNNPNKSRTNYSFATKYCSHHQPLRYSIYDSYVHKLLVYFRDRDNFYNFNSKDLKEYEKFREVITAFQKHYGLESIDLKSLDKYLWQLGKEAFNPYEKDDENK